MNIKSLEVFFNILKLRFYNAQSTEHKNNNVQLCLTLVLVSPINNTI